MPSFDCYWEKAGIIGIIVCETKSRGITFNEQMPEAVCYQVVLLAKG